MEVSSHTCIAACSIIAMIASTVDVRDDTQPCVLGGSELQDMVEYLFRRSLAVTLR
jgi:hypothetical protein